MDNQNDQNNFFSISFKTPPQDDTGLTHILEHLVLCGSRKFPVRDAFFSMLKRSMSTYMNAWTAADITSYPFGTLNEKDYYNLMQIYLDAVFNPLLRQLDFSQEGHRYEFTEENIQSNLTFKGVVYNEMQGVVGDANNFFSFEMNRLLFEKFKDLNNSFEFLYGYSVNYGGEPRNIIDLKYEELVAYHKKYYAPNNALVFTYGNLPLVNHLEFFKDQKILEQFGEMDYVKSVQEELKKVKDFQVQPHTTEIIYTEGPEESIIHNPEKQLKYSMTFFMNRPIDGYFETFCLQIIDLLLLDNPRGPLYQAIIESKLAPRFISITGYEKTDLLRKQTAFIIGVTDIGETDVPLIENAINQTLENVMTEGFSEDYLNSILNVMELNNRRVSVSYATELMMFIPPIWCNGDSYKLEEALNVEKNIKLLRSKVRENSSFFQNLMRKYFRKDNSFSVVMKPNKNHLENFKEFERETLKSIEQSMTEHEKNKTISQAITLKNHQSAEKLKDVDSILPSLNIDDIRPKILYSIDPHVKEFNIHGRKVSLFMQHTNGLVHFSLDVDLWDGEHISISDDESIDLLPFFTYSITKMGTKYLDKKELSEKIGLYTGGISSSVYMTPKYNMENHRNNLGRFGLEFDSESTLENFPTLLNLIDDIINSPRFVDVEYLERLFEEYSTSMSESLTQNGNEFSQSYSSSFLSEYSKLSERITGISHFLFIKEYKEKHAGNLSNVLLEDMKKILRHAFKNVSVAITTDPENIESVKTNLVPFLQQFEFLDIGKKHTFTATAVQENKEKTKTFIGLNFPVNYASISMFVNTTYQEKDAASLSIFSTFLFPILHKEIREKGGAYGQNSRVSVGDQTFSFFTYRDPQTYNSIQVFRKVISSICESNETEITEKDLFESKLSMFKRLDKPVEPHTLFATRYLYDISDEMRQNYRRNLINVSINDLYSVCRKYLVNPKYFHVTIVGNEQKIETDLSDQSEWELIRISSKEIQE